jgi:hypothetical protein
MKKILIVIGLTALLSIPASAELTVNDATSKDYLINHGYSTANVNAIHKQIAEVNGEPLAEPVEQEYYGNPVSRFVRKVFMYMDPSLDDHSFVNDHNIKTSPYYTDL